MTVGFGGKTLGSNKRSNETRDYHPEDDFSRVTFDSVGRYCGGNTWITGVLLAAGGWEPGMRLRPPPPPSEQDSAPRVSCACLEMLCLHGLDIHQAYIIVTNIILLLMYFRG